MRTWRWDQGRLSYFNFNILKSISKVLSSLEGADLTSRSDQLRDPLVINTGMPFSPKTYTVWRNYKRVFECSFLATNINGVLYTSDFCKELANSKGRFNDIDDFFSMYIPRFRFPFPAFQDYKVTKDVIYPFCAVLKYLFSRLNLGLPAQINIEQVFSFIINNSCSGLEDIEFYKRLRPQSLRINPDEKRQVREMLIFISQISILKWFNNHLILDVTNEDLSDSGVYNNLLTPNFIATKNLKEEDFLSLTNISSKSFIPQRIKIREVPSDEIFVEGKKTRVTHLKIERSPLLRMMFLEKYTKPVCNMCDVDMSYRYPWTKYLIEMHHILPLSSTLSITGRGTSIDDVIGLCPSCHRSTHMYYKDWLDQNAQEDFNDKEEACLVYLEAKNLLRL